MTTNYIFGATQGVVQGGELVRLSLKLIAFILFCSLVGKFSLNYLIMTLPLLYLMVFPAIFYTELEVPYRQAINFSLALPVLFLNYSKLNVVAAIRWIIYIFTIGNLILYLYYNEVKLFDNDAFVGMVGNPNSLGLFSCFAILFGFLLGNNYYYSLVVALSIFFAFLSGSMLSIISVVTSLYIILNRFWKIIIISLAIIISMFTFSILDFLDELQFLPQSVSHGIRKLIALRYVLINLSLEVGAHSIENRIVFISDSISRINSIPSFLFGHDNFSEVYFTGDGGLFGYLATHGVLITIIMLYFVSLIVYRGMISRSAIHERAATMVFILMFSLLINRTFDYWPMGVIFCFVLGLSNSIKQSKKE